MLKPGVWAGTITNGEPARIAGVNSQLKKLNNKRGVKN